jgi:hypothetical protein
LVRGRRKGGRSEEFRMNIIVEDITVARMRSQATRIYIKLYKPTG